MTSPRRQPIAFAHRGGRADAPENTVAAFSAALEGGVTGLETDAWITADGVVVLDHDGRAKSGLRSRPISSLTRAQLPPDIPSLDHLYAQCGAQYELSIDVKDDEAAGLVVAAARRLGGGAPGRLWLCHPDWKTLSAWRRKPEFEGIHLVNSTRLKTLRDGPERRAAQLADAGIDALNMHWTEWTGGLVALLHRFERLAFAWDAQHERMIRSLVDIGIDAVYSDHVARLVSVFGRTAEPSSEP